MYPFFAPVYNLLKKGGGSGFRSEGVGGVGAQVHMYRFGDQWATCSKTGCDAVNVEVAWLRKKRVAANMRSWSFHRYQRGCPNAQPMDAANSDAHARWMQRALMGGV